MSELTHFDADGNAVMVDVSEKETTERVAIAKGSVIMQPETLALISRGPVSRRATSFRWHRLAGIMGAKRTPDLIPLCHPAGADLGHGRIEPRRGKHCAIDDHGGDASPQGPAPGSRWRP